jgi:hypothetical protein
MAASSDFVVGDILGLSTHSTAWRRVVYIISEGQTVVYELCCLCLR